jgi:hypothetical protein
MSWLQLLLQPSKDELQPKVTKNLKARFENPGCSDSSNQKSMFKDFFSFSIAFLGFKA